MPTFPVPSGQFAGMTQAQLIAMRTAAQQALTDLLTGNKPESLGYTQGGNAQNVQFSRASVEGLQMLIRQINGALGVSGRRALSVVFL